MSVASKDNSSEKQKLTITYEWYIGDLKNLFEASNESVKSPPRYSPVFGGGRWQIIFYAKSSAEGDSVGLFLSALPTDEERDQVPGRKWIREGVHTFTLEMRRSDAEKTILHPHREANEHSFSSKDTNWGWNKFAPRNKVYFRDDVVTKANKFIVVCVINSSIIVHRSQTLRRFVPNDLIYSVGELLNEQAYSDVAFLLPRRRPGLPPRKILAARKLLARTEYFDILFDSEFSEASSRETNQVPLFDSEMDSDEPRLRTLDFDDSDDDEDLPDSGDDEPEMQDFLSETAIELAEPAKGIVDPSVPDILRQLDDVDVSLKTTKRTVDSRNSSEAAETAPDRPKYTIVVRDVAYSTYYAILYYIYTDAIVFAPLTSSFSSSIHRCSLAATSLVASSTEGPSGVDETHQLPATAEWSSRQDWIRAWCVRNPSRPAPCSAKSAYRLADRLGLLDLREAAFQFIIKSLTVDNIVSELFSSFSQAHDEVRKVQIKFFLENWSKIRTSETLANVWQQIRTGRHPGFEEVWPVIMSSLQVITPAVNHASLS